MSDERFEPRLGRMRAARSKLGRKYLQRVLAAAMRAGSPRPAQRRRFDGSRIGRGAAIGRLLGVRDRLAAFRARRAIVKTRLVRLGRTGIGAARAHLHYIQRDGVQRDGSPGMLYSAGGDQADGKAFLERCDGDRHQFRIIVSAEDGAEYDDLKPLVRRFMAQMEKDLGTRLDWVAVDHVDTAQPHSHIILGGRDDLGQNLVIAREYISRGMRERVAELVTLDLGPRQDAEIRQNLRREISAERLTSIDRRLIRGMNSAAIVPAGHRDPYQHALRAGRLRKLEAMGLAEPLGGGKWRLAHGIEDQLRRLGERGDIVRTMQRELSARIDDLEIDLLARRVRRDGTDIHLTPKEYGVLAELAKHPGRVLTHSHLLRTVWGPAHEEHVEYLRVTARGLRTKIEPDASRPAIVKTEPGVGYRLSDPTR